MEKILSDELTQAITKVGELLKSDPRYREMVMASDDYNKDKQINSLLDEYSALQATLSAEYEKQDFDESTIKPVQARMNEIYEKVTSSEIYVRFKEASEAYSELTDKLYAELEYAVTGQRRAECTHDCSTCHGCD